MAENKRISGKELDDAMLDHDEEAILKKQKATAQEKLEKIQRQESMAQKKTEQKAEEELSVHFQPDDLFEENELISTHAHWWSWGNE